uniref:Glycosyltransferase n=1 Tax=viral metagenome TaxID=1070528 RepID=A0A6C0K513_9ZZZZ
MRITSYNVVLLVSVVIICVVLVELYSGEYSVKQPIELYDFPHHIPRRSKQEEEVRNGVPLVIYQSWKSHEVPKEMRDNILRLLETNPEFDYYLYSDEECAAFIADNYDKDVLAAFHALKPGAFKSDLWRYCILYKLGGVYLDIKYYSTVPLIGVIDENPTVFVKDSTAWRVTYDIFGAGSIYNGFMISPPKNEVFKLCIDEIVESCKHRLYRKNVLDITGPSLLGRILKNKYSSEYIQSLQFSYYEHLITTTRYAYITYKNKHILKQYEVYRNEQDGMFKKDSSKHYFILYAKGDVYQ